MSYMIHSMVHTVKEYDVPTKTIIIHILTKKNYTKFTDYKCMFHLLKWKFSY